MTDKERIRFFLESLRDVFANKAAKESKIISEQLKDKRYE